MKKIVYLFLLLLPIFCIDYIKAQTVYSINFKDGSNQILWTDMVDSMRVVKSNPNVGDNIYDVQEIFMNDTVYKFPLSSIERITFKTPENVYKEGVVRLDDASLRPYIVGSDNLSFSLKSNTPSSLMPKIGDKVVTTECSDLFPRGFIGKILSIEENNGVKLVNCEDLYLHEVFDYYFGTTISEAVPKGAKGILRANDDNKCGARVNPFNQFDILWEPEEPYLFNVAPYLPIRNFSFGATAGIVTGTLGFNIDKFRWDTGLWPHLSIRTTIVVTPQDWLYGCVSVHGDIDVSNVIDMKGSMYDEIRIHNPQLPSFNIGVNDHNFKFDLTEVERQPFYIPEFETGFFVRPSIEAAVKANTNANYKLDGVFNFSWRGEPPLKNSFCLKPQPEKDVAELEGLYFTGALNFGLYLDLKFNIRKDFIQLGLETGGRFEANVAIESNNEEKIYSTKRYETLSKSNVSLTPYTQVYWNPGANIGDIFDFSIPGNSWEKEGYPLFERVVVPVFGNIYPRIRS